MPKTKVQEWGSNANNTDVGGYDISEGCSPANVNDGMREIMAQIATSLSGADDSIMTGTAGSSGTLVMFNADGDLVAATDVGNLTFASGSTATFGGVFTITADGTNTTLTETGSGNTRLRVENLTISDPTGAFTLAFFDVGGAADFYHNATRKLSTTATGIQVVGEVDADSFTGSGFLDEDDFASNAADKVASQQSIKAYVDAQVAAAPGLGVDQTWQDVRGSRAANTVYQNTTGQPIEVSVDWTSSQDFEVSTDGTTWVALATDLTYGRGFTVPDQYYYRVVAGGGSANTWAELR